MTRHWINTISLDHVLLGVEGGFTQAGHGSSTRLRRLERGDPIVFYSPRTAIRTGAVLQQFTALGVVADDEPFQVRLGDDVHPWRRLVDFERVSPVSIRPLLGALGFVEDQENWGMPFRRGLFEVQAGDFAAIAGALRETAGA